jgi:hypothetical protein
MHTLRKWRSSMMMFVVPEQTAAAAAARAHEAQRQLAVHADLISP